jgi:hypothetical protein
MGNAKEKPLSFVKRDDLTPLCCHCAKELTEVYTKAKGASFVRGMNIMYFCPHCLKVLGVGQSRMI